MIACPGCGANLRFDIPSQKMKCVYCGEYYDPYRFDNMTKDADEPKPAAGKDQRERESYTAGVYGCPQCGAELVTTDETDATAFCPYCGGASLLFDKLREEKRPDYIIPFQLSKEDCKTAYLREARKAIFTPRRYKSKERVDSFRGIYMPYWSYVVQQKGRVSIPAETRSERSGDYLETRVYDVRGSVDLEFSGYGHDASRAFDDEISESLEPFDIEKRVPFTPGYLSGFYADVADMGKQRYRDQIRSAYEKSFAKHLVQEVRTVDLKTSEKIYPTANSEKVKAPTEIVKAERAMYPVWFMSVRDGNRITYATVNGQTGKVAADFPISPLRFLLFVLLIAGAVFLALEQLLTLKPGWALAITSLLLLIGVIRNNKQIKKLSEKYIGTVKYEEVNAVERFSGLSLGLGIGCAVLCLIILLVNPVYNVVYYTICFAEALLLFWLITRSFLCQLRLATRRPPQFNKKGGDDNA